MVFENPAAVFTVVSNRLITVSRKQFSGFLDWVIFLGLILWDFGSTEIINLICTLKYVIKHPTTKQNPDDFF